jgi:hypothetical protein
MTRNPDEKRPVYRNIQPMVNGIKLPIIIDKEYIGDFSTRDDLAGKVPEKTRYVEYIPERDFEVFDIDENFKTNFGFEGYKRFKLDEYEFEEMSLTHKGIEAELEVLANYAKLHPENKEEIEGIFSMNIVEDIETGDIRIIHCWM